MREMASYEPAPGAGGKKRKAGQKKDPNAPKRPLSAFFHFCGEHRAAIKEKNPDFSVGDIAKELGARWEKVRSLLPIEMLYRPCFDNTVVFERSCL